MSPKANSQSKCPVDPSLLVDLKSAAEILGIAHSSVRRLIGRESLPVLRAGKGGKIFIPRVALTGLVAGLRKGRISKRPHVSV
jgi:hypothetical protein